MIVEIQNVWKSYDTVTAVRDFTLTMKRGQTLGLIGPNGSGKTTLLRMLSTLSTPDAGEIHVNGLRSTRDMSRIRRMISFMPAEFGTPPDMTIGEFMEYFGCAAGVPRSARPQTIEDVLTLTDLAGREDVLVRGLSTGNKQRLLLAKTLLGDAELLILDEPASGLDPRARMEVRELLRELARMGKSIIISSHILADLQDICDAICIIEQGQKVTDGTMSDLRQKYRRPDRMVILHVPEGAVELAHASLKDLDGVLHCDVEQQTLRVASKQSNCNYILRALLEKDVEILEMHEEAPDLEDIFMESTKGIVS